MYYSTTKKMGLKNEKKFVEGLAWPSAKGVFAEGLTAGTRQRLTLVAAVTHPAIFAEGQFAEG